MCGIAGIIGGYDTAAVERMLSAEGHRGPDGSGVWADEARAVTFGHARLSIIDTSDRGRQPMSYGNGRFRITYNGEIYNYRELRAELERLGFPFATDSDTEVILAAYAAWGPESVARLRGMFAFALLDRDPAPGQPPVMLARDRLGIKPLWYTRIGSRLYFASEIRALAAIPGIRLTTDPDALNDYLTVGAVYQPKSIYRGISAVPAGHYWVQTAGTARTVRYWDLHDATASLRQQLRTIRYDDAVSEVRARLLAAARYAAVSDVEVGAFLSGGIDSTVVTGLMAAEASGPVKTFSVGFDERFAGMDERGYARIAADHLSCDHQEVVVRDDAASELFPAFVAGIDQPSHDGMNTWIVSRSAAQEVKVALSGVGGDELFAGYPHFFSMRHDHGGRLEGRGSARRAVQRLHALRPNRFTARLASRLATPAQRLAALRPVFDDYSARRAVSSPFRRELGAHVDAMHRDLIRPDADLVQQITYTEMRTYMQSVLLRDSDVMSMAHGLELRPVLLDHDLVEYVYALPAELKLGRGAPKQLLIDAAGDIIPDSLRRRAKMGFELPYRSWIGGPLAARVGRLLDSEPARAIFSRQYLEHERRGLARGRTTNGLWTVAVLLAWLDRNAVDINFE